MALLQIKVEVILKACQENAHSVGSKTHIGRTTIQTDIIEIQNIPCTASEECGQEEIGQRVQKSIDKVLERAGKGKLKTRIVVM